MSSYPDTVAYRSIAVTLGQAGHIKELFDVIDSMRSLPKKKFKTGTLERWDPCLEPDIVVYNAVSSTLFVIIYIGETVQVVFDLSSWLLMVSFAFQVSFNLVSCTI